MDHKIKICNLKENTTCQVLWTRSLKFLNTTYQWKTMLWREYENIMKILLIDMISIYSSIPSQQRLNLTIKKSEAALNDWPKTSVIIKNCNYSIHCKWYHGNITQFCFNGESLSKWKYINIIFLLTRFNQLKLWTRNKDMVFI